MPNPAFLCVQYSARCVLSLLQEREVESIERVELLLLVGGVQCRHRDVAHGAELAAIVQVLVLQAEKVPDEPAKEIQKYLTYCYVP